MRRYWLLTWVAMAATATLSASSGKELWPGLTTGNELLQQCDHQYGKFVCLGYVLGVTDVLATLPLIDAYSACIPEGAIKRQVNDVVVAYLRNHPEQRQYIAVQLAAQALSDAFPCR